MYTNNAYLNNSTIDRKDKSKELLITMCGTYKLYTKPKLPTWRPRGRLDFQLLFIASGKAHFHFNNESIAKLAQHGTSMAVFLSSSHLEELKEELYKGAFTPDTPCALCYKVSWEDEKCIRTTLKDLDSEARKAGITRTALVLVGEFLGDKYSFSKLYDPEFTTEYRK